MKYTYYLFIVALIGFIGCRKNCSDYKISQINSFEYLFSVKYEYITNLPPIIISTDTIWMLDDKFGYERIGYEEAINFSITAFKNNEVIFSECFPKIILPYNYPEPCPEGYGPDCDAFLTAISSDGEEVHFSRWTYDNDPLDPKTYTRNDFFPFSKANLGLGSTEVVWNFFEMQD